MKDVFMFVMSTIVFLIISFVKSGLKLKEKENKFVGFVDRTNSDTKSWFFINVSHRCVVTNHDFCLLTNQDSN